MFELPHSNTSIRRNVSPQIPLKARKVRELAITAYAEIDGVGMGRLSDGSAYLTQRGLAKLCGVQNAHIGTISRDWQSDKPRIQAIKARLEKSLEAPHQVLAWQGHRQYGYSPDICRAVLDYYALDAGDHIQAEAQASRLKFMRQDLGSYILKRLAPPKTERAEPLRFQPVHRAEPETYAAMDAVIVYVCGLLAMSAWLANTYLEGLRQRAMNAPWNRLGLYLPLKAILEIQAEAVFQASRAWQGRLPAAADAASLRGL